MPVSFNPFSGKLIFTEIIENKKTSPMGGFIEAPEDKTYPLFQSTIEYKVKSLRIKAEAGTCSVSIQINDSDIEGLDSVAVSTVSQLIESTGSNDIPLNGRVTLVISNSSGISNLEFTIMLEEK